MLPKTVLLFCVLLTCACARQSATTPTAPPAGAADSDVDAAMAQIRGAAIRRHMTVLADDAMRGREAGTGDFQRAADYVAGQFEALGLEPFGDDGSYFQNIEFLESRLVLSSPELALSKGGAVLDLAFRRDFITRGGYAAQMQTVTADLVFVGYGIHAPELGHDDYAGVDVDGKILVRLSGAPPGFDTDRRAFYSSGRRKSAVAAERGAVGIIGLRTPVDQARRPWSRYLPGLGSAGLRWLDEEGRPFLGYPPMQGSATLSERGATRLFELSGHDLDDLFERHVQGATGSFDLAVSATLSRRSTHRQVRSANVLAVLRGSDPALKDEYLVYTGHLDHIGRRPSVTGDEIHNGAYDNAAGVGTILEIAKAMSSSATPPRRSVIFAMVTAEEKGLRGSSYFTRNPPVPVAQIVANINIDMPYLGFPINDVHAFGAEHSTLETAARQATARLGMALTPDPKPEEVRFIRSDQFSFVLQGIPAVAFKAGMQSSDPAIDGAAALDGFLKQHYHRPSDDLSLPFSVAGAERFARAGLVMGLLVANTTERPAWYTDDFFGDKFAPNAAKVAPPTDAGSQPAGR